MLPVPVPLSIRVVALAFLVATFCSLSFCQAFVPLSTLTSAATAATTPTRQPSFLLLASSSKSTSTPSSIESSVAALKRVLEREYISFFDPMRTEYYAQDVTFDDPMTSLAGVQAYQQNVDMLASRTFLGKLLFDNAGIQLHSITGGNVAHDGTISDIVTRWTLRVTAKILPWTPTARFTGVSIYKVVVNAAPSTSSTGVIIVGQTDYWDSVNLKQGGTYGPVDKQVAVADFLSQLSPGGIQAATAAPELPYTLLRRGNGYEVRRYPSFSGVQIKYGRRDEGFGSLGAFTKGMSPMGPAIMTVQNKEASDKFMLWPLDYCTPGQGNDTPPPIPDLATEKAQDAQWRKCQLLVIPSKVVAISDFSDASMEPVVRKADRLLREALTRDGINVPSQGDGVQFAQYDAIFSMGKRRAEVWIDLVDGTHPW